MRVMEKKGKDKKTNDKQWNRSDPDCEIITLWTL